jgi:hypothetical protein
MVTTTSNARPSAAGQEGRRRAAVGAGGSVDDGDCMILYILL